MEHRNRGNSGVNEPTGAVEGTGAGASIVGAGNESNPERNGDHEKSDLSAPKPSGNEGKPHKPLAESTKRKRDTPTDGAGGDENSVKKRPQIGYKEYVESLSALFSCKDIPDQIKYNTASHYAQQSGFPEHLAAFSIPTSTPPSEAAPSEQIDEATSEPKLNEEPIAETPTELPPVSEQEAQAPISAPTPSAPISPRSMFTIPS